MNNINPIYLMEATSGLFGGVPKTKYAPVLDDNGNPVIDYIDDAGYMHKKMQAVERHPIGDFWRGIGARIGRFNHNQDKKILAASALGNTAIGVASLATPSAPLALANFASAIDNIHELRNTKETDPGPGYRYQNAIEHPIKTTHKAIADGIGLVKDIIKGSDNIEKPGTKAVRAYKDVGTTINNGTKTAKSLYKFGKSLPRVAKTLGRLGKGAVKFASIIPH